MFKIVKKGEKRPSNHRRRRPSRVLSNEEIKLFISSPIDNQERVIVGLFVYSGFRRIDVSNSKIEDIDFIVKEVRLKQQKTDEWALMPIPNNLITDLNIYIRTNLNGKKKGYLFPSPRRYNKPLGVRQVSNIVERMCKRVGLSDVLPHDFRATLMTRSGRLGVDESLLSQSLGVSSDTMQTHYKKFTPEDRRKQISRLWDFNNG